MNSERLAFALRPGIFSPSEIKETCRTLDRNNRIAMVFIPDGRTGYEALEISSGILASTNRLSAGSGVIRLLEHDPTLLARRVQTIQALSSNRFILGVGTGTPGPQPGRTLMATMERIEELGKMFQSFPTGIKTPEIYVATLKSGIAKRAVGKSDGLLMNFCSPQHASNIIGTVKQQMASHLDFACYLKIFFSSKSDEVALRLMIQEFLNYDSTTQYHEMFLQDGTAETISKLRKDETWKSKRVEPPESLLKVSLANPTESELHDYVQEFRRAGVTLPVPYPYFPNDEDPDFKKKTVGQIIETA